MKQDDVEKMWKKIIINSVYGEFTCTTNNNINFKNPINLNMVMKYNHRQEKLKRILNDTL